LRLGLRPGHDRGTGVGGALGHAEAHRWGLGEQLGIAERLGGPGVAVGAVAAQSLEALQELILELRGLGGRG